MNFRTAELQNFGASELQNCRTSGGETERADWPGDFCGSEVPMF